MSSGWGTELESGVNRRGKMEGVSRTEVYTQGEDYLD